MNENGQLYDYLNNKFGNCKVLSSGDYRVKYKNNYFYFSSDCTEKNVNLVSYYPGIGGVDSSTWEYRNILAENGMPSNSVMMFASDHNDGGNTFEIFDSVASDVGIDVSSLQTVCYSGSGHTGFGRLNEYLTQHSDLIDSSSLVVVDGYNIEHNIIGGKYSLDLLKDNHIPVYMVVDENKGFSNRVRGLTSQLSDMGINTYLVEMDGGVGHSGANKTVLKDGFAQYVAGLTNELHSGINYKFYKYMDNEFNLINADNIRGNNYLYIELSNIDDIFKNKEIFKIEDTDNEIKNKYSNLESLGQYNYKSLSSSVISSDLQYVQNFANNVVDSVKADSLFDSTVLNIGGGCGPLADAINECLSLYYDGVGSLLNKISLEVDAIVSMGQSFADLDVYLNKEIENNVSSLSDGKVSGNSLSDNQVSSDSVGATDVSHNNSYNNQIAVNNSKENKYFNENNGPKVNEDGDGKKNENNTSSVNNTDNKYNVSSNGDKSNTNNNSQVVYDKGEYDVVFDIDGNNIVSMKYKYEYNTFEEANNIYELLLSKLKDNQDIDNIVLNGNVIEIIFKDSVFENMSVNDMINKKIIGELI